MKIYKKVLFYYCFLTALFISISGILSSQNTLQLLSQLIFLPVTLYFSYSILVQLIDKKESPIKDNKVNMSALIVTVVLFLFLLVSRTINIVNNPTKKNDSIKKISKTYSPKPTPSSYIVLKKEFEKDKINVRDSSSTNAKIIGTLENKPYLMVAKKTSWFEIIFDNKINGFVNEKFVEIKQ
ncbi:SH3 domain-containing protein [Candidatus Roizmanbacteria bacterium]|nr:SH3 domain-containing protein [Candidatus Roizmanbacteria bacterium]